MRARDFAALSQIPEEMLQAGTSEIKNWLVAAGMLMETSLAMEVVDYVPCYRSEAGTGSAMGFAVWR
jgi:seryl-tRNA synthetase